MDLSGPSREELGLLFIQALAWHLHFRKERPPSRPYDEVWKSTANLMGVLHLRADAAKRGHDGRLIRVGFGVAPHAATLCSYSAISAFHFGSDHCTPRLLPKA